MQGSPLYMSPECMAAGEMDENGERIGFSFPTDIWSLGCVALEMITNAPPFSHVKQVKGPAGLTNYVTSLTDVPDLSILFDEPPSVIEFVAACLNPDPEKRATAQDLLQFGIFSEANDEQTMSAVKALKRAQLLHVLNQFVAFQEPEDRERSKTTVGRRAGTDFFDSSSSSSGGDDDSDDEMVKVSLTPKKANDTKVTSGSSTPKGPKRALSTDDDEPDIVIPEDASPTPKKRSKTVAPEGSTENPNRSATNNSTDNNNSNARNTGKDPLHKRSASEDLESGFFHSSDSSAGKSDEENPHQKGIPTLPRPATVTSSALTRNPTSGFGNHSFGAPNASFYNFSFNKNISFLGGNIDDVLNSAANEFLHGLSGGVDVKSPDEMRILHSVETSRDNSRRASKSPSIRSPDTSAVGSRREEDSNSGLRAISRQQLARPGVVNRSFFMVEDLQIPFLSNSSVSNNNVVSMVTGGTTQNSSTQEIPAPRDAAGRRQAIRFADPNAAIPITLTEETLQIHQGMMDREGDSISPRTVDQASSQFHSISSDSKGLDSLAKVQEELQEIAKGLSAFLYSRSAPPPLVAKNAVSISSCSSSAGKEPGDNPLSNGSSAGDGVKCLPPGKPPAVPPSDSHLQRLFGVLSHVQSLSTYVRDQLKSKQEEEFSALDKKK
ncbi:Protein kinase domain containing protein, putative [Angomonas deanei]|uniref:Protein kinase domain containing protein, putative n=1 Tax=Angomonas deanei TaxID=59799 RepID=A0A7G2CSI3_9TRYP|nr:Protein kinase domain containing protein, putative [Angomonas deanei]